MGIFKMSARFWPNKPIKVSLHLRALFWNISCFLTKVAHFNQQNSCAVWFGASFINSTVVHAVLHKFYLKQESEVPCIL